MQPTIDELDQRVNCFSKIANSNTNQYMNEEQLFEAIFNIKAKAGLQALKGSKSDPSSSRKN